MSIGLARELMPLLEYSKLERSANETHYAVGEGIRKTIKKLGEAMPGDLTISSKSLKELEKENKKHK